MTAVTSEPCLENIFKVGARRFLRMPPTNSRYRHKKMFVVDIGGYVYLVPFVETKEAYFLKTVFPSRKATKGYIEGGKSYET